MHSLTISKKEAMILKGRRNGHTGGLGEGKDREKIIKL